MSDKRFTYLNTTGWNKEGFLNVMNGLNEKNKKLQKENEQLKQSIKRQQSSNEECSKYIEEVQKENEQLKQFIQELTTKGTGEILLANGYVYKVDTILTDFKW